MRCSVDRDIEGSLDDSIEKRRIKKEERWREKGKRRKERDRGFL
jgi:hypothetical protein